MSEFFVGLDLGQSVDYTALAMLEKVSIYGEENANLERPLVRTELHCRYAARLPLGTSYPAVVKHVTDRLESPALKGHVALAIDYTGVGRPVADMFTNSELSCPLTLITIHGGDAVTWDGNHARVPKRDLIGATQVDLQNGVLKIVATLPEAATLVKELQNFQVKIDPVTAHDSYSAWREGIHDDLVLAVSMACWIAAESQPVRFVRLSGV